jgi:long-chain acyl-CoA synthetase
MKTVNDKEKENSSRLTDPLGKAAQQFISSGLPVPRPSDFPEPSTPFDNLKRKVDKARTVLATPPVDRPRSLVELFESGVRRFYSNRCIGTQGADGEYHWKTLGELKIRVDDFRAGLASLGVGHGDSVAIIGKNSVEWAVGAFATFGLRARWVPMYEAELESVRRYILQDAAVKVLLVSTPELLEHVRHYVDEIPTLEHVICIEGDGADTMAKFERRGRKKPVASQLPTPEDIAMIIYTSGTTGDPKGVLLSHRNLTSNALDGSTMVSDLDENSCSLSILPWAHAYGLTAELLNMINIGGSIGIAQSVTSIADDILKVRPTHLIAVPRVFNRIYSNVRSKVVEKGGLPEKLFNWSLKSAAQKRELLQKGRTSKRVNMKVALADKIVFSKIRAKLGGRLRVAVTGSATMNEEIARFFSDCGITVLDCYGLTETSPAVTMNTLETVRFGTVGKPIPGVRVEIDKSQTGPDSADGEVVVYGPNVMVGYHNKPDATAAVLDPDGGLRTGDLGSLDEDGYLRITGRIKEQYKLSNGKYVFPAAIEEELKLMPEFSSAMVYGEGKDYNICLVVPDYEYLKRWAAENNLSSRPEDLYRTPELHRYLEQKLQTFLQGKFGSYEIPKKLLVLKEDFSPDNGMLTQTLKLKRRVVLERYSNEISSLYQ